VNLTDAPDVLTVPEVAAILRVNRDSAYELVRRGELQAVHIGRSVRVTRWALEAYLRGGGEHASP
jgi:excisionase family DNA binding protein